MSLLLASKYVVLSHIHLGAFSGFCIISFNSLVKVKWDDERAFNQKFGTLSIPGDFHFWDLVNAALSSSTVMFCHSCSFTFSFYFSILPIQLADILQASFSPHIPLAVFYTVLRWFFLYHDLLFSYFSKNLLASV